MSLYGKIFADIFDSSIMAHGGDTVYVFICLIVLADQEGYVRQAPAALASRIGKDLPTVLLAINHLEAVDPSSSSPEHEGRRIVALRTLTGGSENRGWWIVNHAKYREIARHKERAEKSTARVQRWRETQRNADVTPRNATLTLVTPSEAEAYADTRTTLSRSTLHDMAHEVLKFLSEKTGRQYRAVEANLNPIVMRLKSGVTVQDCKTMIMRKWHDWHADPKMEKYLRPKTLFAASNFENYLGECIAK